MQAGNESEPKLAQGQYAGVNGLEVYYEVHGAGEPLVMLHGGFGSIGMFGGVLDILAEGRQVIAVDLQAHGRTADIQRPLVYESLADDIAALIRRLGLKSVDVMGYSLGGHVALRTAIQHPGAVGRLTVVSIPFKRSGMYPEILAQIDQQGMDAEAMKNSPMYESYAAIAPRPQDWPVLVRKMLDLQRRDFDWSTEIPALKIPILIVAGDADIIRTSHIVEFFELLGGGQRDAGWDGSGMSNARLCILPDTTHYNIFSSPELARAVIRFLDEDRGNGMAPSTNSTQGER